jgi:prepilin-type N-terminal cleavage/methylation domain-containing protein
MIPLTPQNNRTRGFTLIELLIIIAVIAILAGIAFAALNPLARFRDARNARRWTDVNAVLSAIKLNQIDNGGNLYTDLVDLVQDNYYQIGTGEDCNMACAGVALQPNCVNIAGLSDSGHLPIVPVDPGDSDASPEHTRYFIVLNNNGTLTVGSCSEEAGSSGVAPEISVTR